MMKKISKRFHEVSFFIRSLLSKNRLFLFGIFLIGLSLDIFINPKISDLLVLILIGLWVINIFVFKITPIQNLVLATTSYLVAFVTQFLGNEMVMEKGASWFFIFLTIAIIQKLAQEFWRHEVKT